MSSAPRAGQTRTTQAGRRQDGRGRGGANKGRGRGSQATSNRDGGRMRANSARVVASRSATALSRLRGSATRAFSADDESSWRPSLPSDPFLDSVLFKVDQLCSAPTPVPIKITPALRTRSPIRNGARSVQAASGNGGISSNRRNGRGRGTSPPQTTKVSRTWGSTSGPQRSQGSTPADAPGRRIWTPGPMSREIDSKQRPTAKHSAAARVKFAPPERVAAPHRVWQGKRSAVEAVASALDQPPPPPLVENISIATWNVSAVNNNPFEYFFSHDDAHYVELMQGVEDLIISPGDADVPVHTIFTDAWFSELKDLMDFHSISGASVVEEFWNKDYRERKIISGFLKDKAIGAKRLISMPDRITNRINIESGADIAYRPTVINNYSGSLASLDEWWEAWKDFMFHKELKVKANEDVKAVRPCEMLGKISSSKYPEINEDEESVSIPLQILCQAIFDAVMVHIMMVVSPDGHWQVIRKSITEAIYTKKATNTINILSNVCHDVDIICLQECAAAFKEELLGVLGEVFHVYAPQDSDAHRDQNSMVLLSKDAFPGGVDSEVTSNVLQALPAGTGVMPGDICAITARHRSELNLLLASFHGDTNGLQTNPVTDALLKTLSELPPDTRPFFGMDANVYLSKKEGFQNVVDFLDRCRSLGLHSCWPDGVSMEDCCTTCNARTYLQPQLNKAVRSADKLIDGDVNPKDHILIQGDSFELVSCTKDNTGERRYIEKECFPSLQFPSDHGLVLAVFRPIKFEDSSIAVAHQEQDNSSAHLMIGDGSKSLDEDKEMKDCEESKEMDVCVNRDDNKSLDEEKEVKDCEESEEMDVRVNRDENKPLDEEKEMKDCEEIEEMDVRVNHERTKEDNQRWACTQEERGEEDHAEAGSEQVQLDQGSEQEHQDEGNMPQNMPGATVPDPQTIEEMRNDSELVDDDCRNTDAEVAEEEEASAHVKESVGGDSEENDLNGDQAVQDDVAVEGAVPAEVCIFNADAPEFVPSCIQDASLDNNQDCAEQIHIQELAARARLLSEEQSPSQTPPSPELVVVSHRGERFTS